ncbi:hypothetical protein ACFPPF_16180 [Xenophilus aerolatus]|nr:hypothetical protein [Xenophilus aerolatus]
MQARVHPTRRPTSSRECVFCPKPVWRRQLLICGGAAHGGTIGGELVAQPVALSTSARVIDSLPSISDSLVIAAMPLPFLGACGGFFSIASKRGRKPKWQGAQQS